jgi:1,4-alpha-glucan branching enzyme
MFEIRKADPDGFSSPAIAIAHIHDDNGIVAFTRGDGKYMVVMNFRGNGWDYYGVGVTGRYRELANTSWADYNIGGYPQRSRGDQPQQINDVPIPPYGVVVLQRSE